MAPAVAAAILEAFDVLEEEGVERSRILWRNARYFIEGLRKAGFDTGLTCTAIVPIMVVTEERALMMTKLCQGMVVQTMGEPLKDLVRGNIKARERMILQYAVAGQENLLVVGTDHAAEAVSGFFTKFGDGGVDLTPLTGLTKRQGAQLLWHLDAPESVTAKVPTADLEDDRPALPDEEVLGVTYSQIDDYLEGHDVDAAVADRIESLFLRTRHKRTVPVTPFDDWWKS